MMGSQTGKAKNAGVKFTIPINLGTPIAIKAYLNQLKEPVMSMIEINLGDKGITGQVKDYIVGKITGEPWSTGEKITGAILIIAGISRFNPSLTAITTAGGFAAWVLIENYKPIYLICLFISIFAWPKGFTIKEIVGLATGTFLVVLVLLYLWNLLAPTEDL